MSLRWNRPSSESRGRRVRATIAALAATAPLLATLCFAPPAVHASLKAVVVAPQTPSTCDSVTIRVEGDLPSSCYTLLSADISGPAPFPEAAGPLPTYGFRIRVLVQEPNPLIDIPCTAGPVPYSHRFPVGILAPGIYDIRAVEYIVPWERPNAPRDTSVLFASFPVTIDQACPPSEGCALLDFRPPGGASIDRFCDAVGRPGGQACFDVGLGSPIPVGGVQLEIDVNDLRASPAPLGTFTPKSVATTPRTEGFQVAWQADGSKVKALLYSSDGRAIPAGRGPILRVCYGISDDARDGAVQLRFGQVVISDSNGTAIPPCPTFAEETGWLCVGSRECDVNGDGRSNIVDVVQLVRCAISGLAACPDSIAARADCNGDGAVDVRDVICCVRRILDGGGPDAPASGALGDPANYVGFAGPVRWVSPTDGRATIELAQDEAFAGMQFRLVPTGPVRIRGVSVVRGGSNVVLDWQAGQDGSVRAILYEALTIAAGGSAPAGVPSTIRLEAMLEPLPGGSGAASISLLEAGSATWSGAPAPTQTTVGTVDAGAPGVAAPAVYPARPNPFVSDTEIAFALPAAGRASLRVYDVRGRLVRVLVDGESPAGVRHVRWNGRDASGGAASAGIYFVKLNALGVERTQRLLRLR